MGMVYGQKPAKLFNGLVIGLFDEDDNTHFHGVVVCPDRLTTEDDCNARIDHIYAMVKDQKGEEWNYDDVIEALKADGFYHIACGVWVE